MNVTNNFSGVFKPLIYNVLNNSEDENQKQLDQTANRIETLFERKYQEKKETLKRQKDLDESLNNRLSRPNSEGRTAFSRARSSKKVEIRTPTPEPEEPEEQTSEKKPEYLSTNWINQKISKLE